MKHDISKHPYWTREQFMAFILFYAAHADMECTEEERQIVRNIISEEQLPEIESEYQRLTDFERIEVIQSYKNNYFANTGQKAVIIEELKHLCNADGEYDIMEKNLVMMLGRIL